MSTRALVVVLVSLAVLGSGCSCEEPTDEERLREQLDVTKVHLYVATKMALGNAEADGRVGEARTQILRMYRAAVALGETDDPSAVLSVVEGTDGLTLDGAAIDAVELATGLYELRALGRDEVRRWGDEEAPMVLPILLAQGRPEAAATLAGAFDRDTEHALLLLVLFVAKFHPRTPVPVPVELMLYEGYVTDVNAMGLQGFVPIVLGIRSYIYATSTYCDLAAEDGHGLDGLADEEARAGIGEAIGTLGVETDETARGGAMAALAALAHGSTALCFLEREETERANEELTAFCDRAEESGVPAEELAMLRAYLAIQNADYPEARTQLARARTREGISDAEVEEIDQLIEYLDDDDRGMLGDYFDRAFLATWTLRYTFNRLEASGFLEGLEQTEPYRALTAFMVAVLSTLQSAQRAIPSVSETTSWGGELWESWTQ